MITFIMGAFALWVVVGLGFDAVGAWPHVRALFAERDQLDAAQRRFEELNAEETDA